MDQPEPKFFSLTKNSSIQYINSKKVAASITGQNLANMLMGPTERESSKLLVYPSSPVLIRYKKKTSMMIPKANVSICGNGPYTETQPATRCSHNFSRPLTSRQVAAPPDPILPFAFLVPCFRLQSSLTKQTSTILSLNMLKQESNWAQACDTCRSAACTVYCRADSAYLCTSCDAQIHAANRLASRHERVRVCESCERAPAAFFCKADAASLCTACDSQIHSANPLARRHQRVPILPISGCVATNHHSSETTEPENIVVVGQEEEDEAEAASWLLPSSVKNCGDHNNNNNSENNRFSVGEEYLDLVDYSSSMDKRFTGQSNQYQQDYNVPQRSYVADGVVPLQVGVANGHMHHEKHNFQFGFTNVSSEASPIHMVSLVPESVTSDATVSHPRSPKAGTEELPEAPVQMLSPMERKARVLRYREKKKTRKFEKRIRYASRKEYAEKRPRIKGRFAKRNEVDADHALSTMVVFDTGYGIVPSFS